jgi:hypothetical protein
LRSCLLRFLLLQHHVVSPRTFSSSISSTRHEGLCFRSSILWLLVASAISLHRIVPSMGPWIFHLPIVSGRYIDRNRPCSLSIHVFSCLTFNLSKHLFASTSLPFNKHERTQHLGLTSIKRRRWARMVIWRKSTKAWRNASSAAEGTFT